MIINIDYSMTVMKLVVQVFFRHDYQPYDPRSLKVPRHRVNRLDSLAKVRKTLPKYLIPSEEVDAVVFKQDRGEILMLIRYEDWLFEKAREKDNG